MNENQEKFRYELKYVCSDLQLTELEQRIAPVLKKDAHVNRNGQYTIRSLYFDDYYDSCFWEKENGTNHRKKFRLRIYNGDISRINLEIKYKQQEKTRKEKADVTFKQYGELISGTPFINPMKGQEVFNQLLILKATKLMRPTVIVEYERVPYVGKEGNVRITFDRNIRSSQKVEDFTLPAIPMRSIMPTGKHLLEVKFDEFLPDYIHRLLSLEGMIKTSFSKYYLCRKFY